MSSRRSQPQTQALIATRKQKYKELIEKGSKVSEYRSSSEIFLFIKLPAIFTFLGESLETRDVLESFQNILDIVHSCEGLAEEFVKDGKIENAGDYLMDAQILKMSHELMGSTAEKMGNSEFSEEEYITALTNLLTIDTGEHDFNKLSDVAIKCCRTSQFSISLLGTFDFEAGPRPEKVRKVAQREKKAVGPTKNPTNITQLTRSNKGAEKINVVRSEIQRICRERQTDSIPYFEVICDPSNFMKTIDISFQISFLVRDGFLGLKKIEGEPHVYLYVSDSKVQQRQAENTSDTVQCIVSLNPRVWKEKIKKFKIKSPLLHLDEEEKENAEEMDIDSDD